MISKNNFIKKLIGMCVFQTAIILFYASIGVKEGATIPIYLPEHDPHGEQAYAAGGPEALAVEQVASYANPLPHVLMLTAIVVGVATFGIGLGFVPKIYQGYGTVEEDELMAKLEKEDAANLKPNVGVTGKTASKPKRASRAKGGAANPAGKTTAVQAKKSSGPRKSKAPAGKAPAKKTPRKAVRKKRRVRMMENAIAWILLFLFSGAVAAALFGMGNRKVCWPIGVLCMTGSFVAGVLTLLQAIDSPDHEVSYVFGGWIIDSFPRGVGIEFRADLMAALITLIVLGVGLCVAVYAKLPVEQETPGKEHFFYPLFLLQITGLAGICMTGDAFNLYVLIEVAALTGYGLIAMGGKRAAAATFNYVILGTIGASLYLLGVGYLYIKTGSLNMVGINEVIALDEDLKESASMQVAFVLVCLGILIKMAFFLFFMPGCPMPTAMLLRRLLPACALGDQGDDLRDDPDGPYGLRSDFQRSLPVRNSSQSAIICCSVVGGHGDGSMVLTLLPIVCANAISGYPFGYVVSLLPSP